MQPRAVLFDLDNTLVHRNQSIVSYSAGFAAHFADRLHTPDAARIARLICSQDNGGYLSADSPFASIKDAIAVTLAAELDWKTRTHSDEIKAHWVSHFPHHAVEMPGATPLLRQLVARGVRVGVISNGAERSRQATVDALAFRDSISILVSSERAGVRKPDPAIFGIAAAELGVATADCWYVGDHPRNDVLGAQRAGMQAIWLEGFHDWQEDVAPAHSIAALQEIDTLIARHASIT